MLKLKPTYLKEKGKEKFVVLSIEEFAAVREALEDAEDARILDEAVRRNAGKPGIPLEQIKRELGIASPSRKNKKRNAGTQMIPHAAVVRRISLRRKLAKAKH